MFCAARVVVLGGAASGMANKFEQIAKEKEAETQRKNDEAAAARKKFDADRAAASAAADAQRKKTDAADSKAAAEQEAQEKVAQEAHAQEAAGAAEEQARIEAEEEQARLAAAAAEAEAEIQVGSMIGAELMIWFAGVVLTCSVHRKLNKQTRCFLCTRFVVRARLFPKLIFPPICAACWHRPFKRVRLQHQRMRRMKRLSLKMLPLRMRSLRHPQMMCRCVKVVRGVEEVSVRAFCSPWQGQHPWCMPALIY